MIINIGGRTDIVNYYTPWFINRLNEGFVYSRNPYRKNQVYKYELNNKVVDCIILCSKNYTPILNDIKWIDEKFNTFSYYTITSYTKEIEPKVPSIDESINTLKKLSSIVGKKKVSWRFDPILLTNDYTIDKHLECFDYIASQIHDDVSFCVFSFVDMYKKLYVNMSEIIPFDKEDIEEILIGLGKISKKYKMPIQSCAVKDNYSKYGINKSGCMTAKVLSKANDIHFKKIKHRGNRPGCSCLPSRDIGAYDTCLNECKYCYANKRPKIAKKNFKYHDENSPLLLGKLSKNDKIIPAKQVSFLNEINQQRLF